MSDGTEIACVMSMLVECVPGILRAATQIRRNGGAIRRAAKDDRVVAMGTGKCWRGRPVVLLYQIADERRLDHVCE